MKKTFLMLSLIALITGCEKENESLTQTLMVNVSYTYSSNPDYGDKLSDKAFVFIFKDNGKEVDNEESDNSVIFDLKMTYKDGTKSDSPIRSSESSVNTFEDVPNGNYIIWVAHIPYAATVKTTSTKVSLKPNDDLVIKKVVLDMDLPNGYQVWKDK